VTRALIILLPCIVIMAYHCPDNNSGFDRCGGCNSGFLRTTTQSRRGSRRCNSQHCRSTKCLGCLRTLLFHPRRHGLTNVRTHHYQGWYECRNGKDVGHCRCLFGLHAALLFATGYLRAVDCGKGWEYYSLMSSCS
jgi:hypothetical protein